MAMPEMSKVPVNSGTAPKAPEPTDLVGTDGRLRAPFEAEQELGDRYLLEEADSLEQDRQDDADGREYRDGRACDQEGPDDRLDAIAGAQIGTNAAQRDTPRQRPRARSAKTAKAASLSPCEVPIARGGRRYVGVGALSGDAALDDVLDVVGEQIESGLGQFAHLARELREHELGDDRGLKKIHAASNSKAGIPHQSAV